MTSHNNVIGARSVTPSVTPGFALGFLGVLGFSVSLPATQPAVRDFGVLFVSFGRAVVAGVCALMVLAITRTPLPPRRLWKRLALVVLGVVIGFPTFTGLALQRAPAGHSSVVIGILPAVTAGFGVVLAGERPSRRYWMFAAIGSGAITVLALAQGSRTIAVGDLFLVVAVFMAAMGYAYGAITSKELGGWQTISWAVVLGLPVNITLATIGFSPVNFDEPATSWMCFAYLGLVSMFLAFFAWYSGLAKGGIARVSQVQLLQPILSLVWATLFLHESLDLLTVVVAVIVLASVVGSKKSAILTAPTPAHR
jgi:drug/metabolite transporter (DMT)-like permease